jgi:predicted PurR-regulated permease PerM
MLPERRQSAALAMLCDLEPKLRWWLIGTMISMMAVGVLSWLGFMAIGLRFAATLAILMALAEIVPNIGPAVGFLIALMVALAQGKGQVFGVIGVWCVIQVAESYVLQPLIMKRAVKVPPVVTLFTVVLWGKVLGVGGLLLAIPIDLVVWSAAVHFAGKRNQSVKA